MEVNLTVQYTDHVIIRKSRDQYTALSLAEVPVTKYGLYGLLSIISNKNATCKKKYNRSKPDIIRLMWDIIVFRLVGYLLNMICLNLLLLYKIVYICIFVYFWHSFISISRDRNIRKMSYMYRSTPEILRFHPITPFIFPLQSL